MSAIIVRLSVLALISLALLLLIWLGKRFVARQRQQALAARPLNMSNTHTCSSSSQVRILAFSSPDCRQCRTLQAPALLRIQAARGHAVSIVEVDAPTSPELTQRYRVLTVPTTVVLDATGHAHTVNYGFTDTRRLLEQVDAVLAQAIP
ncbi:MAG: hypothetical protein NVS4B7_19270 [Ktedonobacteraceae bacterium]